MITFKKQQDVNLHKLILTDTSLELALCRIGRDDIIAPQSDVTNERRIQRNIYQERQASEEIEAYKGKITNTYVISQRTIKWQQV